MPKLTRIQSTEIPIGPPKGPNDDEKKSSFGKAVKWLNSARETVQSKVSSKEARTGFAVWGVVEHVVKAAVGAFKLLNQSSASSSPVMHLRKIGVIGLLAVPVVVLTFVDSLVNLAKAVQSASLSAIVDAGLLATAALGSMVDAPAKIAFVVNEFQTVANVAVWGSALGAVSAILSIASMIHTARSHETTRTLVKELESTSNRAFLSSLRERLNQPGSEELKLVLQEIDQEIDIVKIFDEKAFTEIDELGAVGNSKELKKIIAAIETALVNADEIGVLAQLQEVANAAYVECLLEKDEALLARHFKVKGEALKVALESIKSLNKPAERHTAVSHLKIRLADKLFMDKFSILLNNVNLAISIAFVVIGLVASATPAAPAVYAISAIVGVIVIAKMIYEHQQKKEFERNMGIRLPKPVPIHAPEQKPRRISSLWDGSRPYEV